jgi:hypothetical protein
MKNQRFIPIVLFIAIFASCDLVGGGDSIKGEQSAIGEVGVKVTSSSASVAGVSGITGSVVSHNDGVSSYTGSATITSTAIKNILANSPDATINGNNVTLKNVKFKVTTEGIEAINGFEPGIIVKYDSKVGDTYKLDDGRERKVTSKSTDDDYSYGFFLIKVVKVEETPNKLGVKKITYWANHKFGLVGVEITYDDNSTSKFPIYSSAEN